MKQLLPLLLCAALLLLSGCGAKEDSGAGPAPEPETAPAEEAADAGTGTTLAQFSAGTLDGETFTQADIQSKDVTVLNFWALSCGPCIAELPDLADLAAALPENVQLITVCLDGYGSEDTAREVLEEAGFTGITLISGDGDLAALAGSLIYTPTTVFVDSQGAQVVEPLVGAHEDLAERYLTAINAVLAQSGITEISLDES